MTKIFKSMRPECDRVIRCNVDPETNKVVFHGDLYSIDQMFLMGWEVIYSEQSPC